MKPNENDPGRRQPARGQGNGSSKHYRVSAVDVKAAARGKWPELLTEVGGIPAELLDGKGHPCPKCGGTDRFSLVDPEAGALLCRQCFASKNGDGLAAVAWARGCSFPVAIKLVAEHLGLVESKIAPKRKLAGNGKPAGKTYATSSAAVAELERQFGPRSAMWTYHDTHGEPVGVVLRWNPPDGDKKIRPVSRHGNGWRIGGMPEPRPLYRLPELADAPYVYVCEGEKAVDAARTIGLVATTSPHGAQSAGKADWRPLAGKSVVILPDNDKAGMEYADDVVAELTKLTPAPTVRLVALPELPEAGDIVDWLTVRDATEPDDLRGQIESLAAGVEPIEPAGREPPLRFKPFPVHALPRTVRRFVSEAASAIGCDPSFVAMSLLSGMAAAIGNARKIVLKDGWEEPATIWTCVVGESGTAKTPAQTVALEPIRARQAKMFDEHKAAIQKHLQAETQYDTDLAAWKRSKCGPAPVKPEPPECRRVLVSDTTIEALAPILQANWRGVLLERDELSGWLGSFDQYRGSKGAGADVPKWLSIFSASNIIIDRKTGVPRTIFVPRANVSICGGVQPEIFRLALGRERFQDGLAARLLLAMPPPRTRRWTEATVSTEAKADLEALFGRLMALEPACDMDGKPIPRLLPLTMSGKAAWVAFDNAHLAELADLTGDMSAAWSKLEAYTARLALIVHLVRHAEGDPTVEHEHAIDAESMRAAVALVEWFKNETRRVYAMFAGDDDDREQNRLVDLIERKGGAVTAREIRSACGGKTDAAETALNTLAKAGLGEWESVPAGTQGGRPTRVFRLFSDLSQNQNPENHAGNEGFGFGLDDETPEMEEGEL